MKVNESLESPKSCKRKVELHFDDVFKDERDQEPEILFKINVFLRLVASLIPFDCTE